jgi:hypothetical protein
MNWKWYNRRNQGVFNVPQYPRCGTRLRVPAGVIFAAPAPLYEGKVHG